MRLLLNERRLLTMRRDERLAALLEDQAPEGSDPVVTGLAIDHRKVAPGTIFTLSFK